jgi:hypothetical protein
MIVQPMLISAWTASSTSVSVSTLFAFYLVAEEVQARPALSMRTALLRETNAIMASVRLQAAEVTPAMLAVLTPTAPPQEMSVTTASVRPLGEATATVVPMQLTVSSL